MLIKFLHWPVFVLIHCTKLLTRANTVWKSGKHRWPQLTTPLSIHRLPSKQARGPPLSPLQPPWSSPIAHSMESSSILFIPFILLLQELKSSIFNSASWRWFIKTPCSFRPHPKSNNNYYWTLYSTSAIWCRGFWGCQDRVGFSSHFKYVQSLRSLIILLSKTILPLICNCKIQGTQPLSISWGGTRRDSSLSPMWFISKYSIISWGGRGRDSFTFICKLKCHGDNTNCPFKERGEYSFSHT